MNCAGCGRANRDGARFCDVCGDPLVPRCPSCDVECRADARFCDACGASLVAHPAEAGGVRKVVSIVFADLVGSTALHERLDPESARRFMEGYYGAMRGAVEAHGGTVTQLLGDGVKAVFGIPRVSEDDAICAVRAAVAMQESFRALAEQQRGAVGKTGLRVAVNTGEVVAKDETEIIGDPVNVAARLQEQGKDGDVVVGESTNRLVSSLVTLELLGSFALKGRSEAVKAYRVVSLDRPADAATVPFVGRIEELARLAAVYDTAVSKPAAGLAVLVGSPGLGKSRLIDEFARRHADAATVVRAHCDAAGGATFAPLAQALRALLGIVDGASPETLLAATEGALAGDDADRSRIAGGIAALLAGSPASPEETFFVVRRMLGALAQARPVVLVIDDLHWAEPLLLDLVEHLIQWGSGVPLLVLIGARPELRDLRSALVTPGGLVADVVTLSGLDAGAAMRLAANVIGAADLPAAIAAKVLATSEGNPLFVGELVRMLVQEGALLREGDRWTVGANLASLEMPPTVHALLAARIERLRPEERAVLERAAVVGRHFSRSAVAALLPREAGDLDARIEALRRSELIERDTGWLLGEPVLRFHHVLIRDAAYRRLLKGTRAELHAKLAEWIEAQVGDAPDHDETIGWHLEQAHQHLHELGPIDAKGRILGERASARLAAAGRRALTRDDLSLAGSLLGRALQRLDFDDAARADLALDWCEALLALGDVGPATSAIDELDRFTGGSARLKAWHTCFVGQHTVLTAPSALHATADAVAAAADILTSLGDGAGEAKAHFVHALALSRLGKVGGCEAALDRALAAARRAGDRRRANTVLAIAPLAALWGPSPVTRASGRCLDVVRVLRITQGAPAVEAVALSCQGVLEALRGRTDAARRMIASARKMVEELGITQRLLEADVFSGLVEWLDGDASAAEQNLRGAYTGLRELGLGTDAARAAALLARALLAQDRVTEAEALSHESEALAGDDLKAAIAWRGVRAEALARRGDHAAAVAFASKAVELAAATDALLDHADARLALAAALRAADRSGEAEAEERRATELWEAKGATLLADRARADASRAAAVAAPATKPIVASPAAGRRVRANAATTMLAGFANAVAARDFDGVAACFHANHQEIDHPTGSTYGRDACIASMQRLFRSNQPHYEAESIATLGEFLVLTRRRSGAGGASSGHYDVGAYENEAFQLFEVDERGLTCRSEVFAADHLRDAVNRLYERHAELLPEGPERTRAAAAAQSMVDPKMEADLDRVALTMAPECEVIDHRHLSNWSSQGAEARIEHLRAMWQVADNIVFRDHDILALTSNAKLTRVMHTGTDRAGGGVYERPFLMLFVTGADGKLARVEFFDADGEGEALARFDALTAEPALRSRRRARANAATRSGERFTAILVGRDGDALADQFNESLRVVHHPSGLTYGRREMLATWQSALKARRLEFRQEVLASLGDALSLNRHVTTVEGLTETHFTEFGVTEVDEISLIELDDRERVLHVELFAADHLGDAIVRLYERCAAGLPEGPDRARAAAVARSLQAFNGPIALDQVASAYSPVTRIVDHRVLGTWSARDAEEILRHWRLQLDLAPDCAGRFDDVLALEPDALVAQMTFLGTGRDSGGAFENRLCVLLAFGADGRVTRNENFESKHEVNALARLDALRAELALPPWGALGASDPELFEEPFANTASRLVERGIRRWAARDLDGVLSELSPAMRMNDRRRITRLEIGYEDFVAQFRTLFDQPGSRWRHSLLATRGERLSLHRMVFEAEVQGEGGELAFEEHLSLTEVDAEGRWIASVTFDLEDEDVAYAELDVRYEAHPDGTNGHTGIAFVRAIGRRDLDAVAVLCSPAFVEHDHRSLAVLGTTHGAEAWVRNFRALVELAPDTIYRSLHLRSGSRGFLSVGIWQGSREGGRYEIPLIAVLEVDERGAMTHADLYDPDQCDPARARFDELKSAHLPARFANAASRGLDRAMAAWSARDWDGFARVLALECRQSDRRKMVQLELDRTQSIAFARQLGEMASTRVDSELLATRGDRLSLSRHRVEAADGAIGPSEIESLMLYEANDLGEVIAYARFDQDDVAAAYAELDARFAAGEAAAHPLAARWLADYLRCFSARDWDAMRALFAPGLVGHNHRLVGWGTLHGAAALVSTLEAQIELALDTQERVDHVRTCARGVLVEYAWHGTHQGGTFENVWLVLVELDAESRAQRADVWEAEQLDAALARFAELAAAVPSVLRFANAASATSDPIIACLVAHDWVGFEALFAESFRCFDRRRMVQLDFDRDGYVAFTRKVADGRSARGESAVLATRGERLALVRSTFVFADEDVGPSEIAFLLVTEVDERGCIVAYVRCDPDDCDAAYAELDARWAAGEAAAHPRALASLVARRGAQVARDWDGLAACFAPDVVCHDRRLLGWGTLQGADAYMQTQRMLAELAPDFRLRAEHIVAAERGLVVSAVIYGTRYGGPFELPFLEVDEFDALGKISRMDLYDVDRVGEARVRFDEVCAKPRSDLRAASVKPNLATASMERSWIAFDAQGLPAADEMLEASRAYFAPDFVWEDRRPVVGLSGGLEMMIASARERVASGFRQERRTIVGTAGDRVAVARVLWAGGPEDGRFEVEFLSLREVNEAGLCTALLFFEPDDTRAAQCEAWARWAAIDPVSAPWVELLTELADAWNGRERARLRACFADDVVVEDHRFTGVGRIESADAYVDSNVVLWDLAPDQRIGYGWSWPALERHGIVATLRREGRLADGGAFESDYVWLSLASGGRITRLEIFEIDALQTALARFEALRPAGTP